MIPVQQIQLPVFTKVSFWHMNVTPKSCAYSVYIWIGSNLFTLCTVNDKNNELWYLTVSRRISRFLNNSLLQNFVSCLPNRFYYFGYKHFFGVLNFPSQLFCTTGCAEISKISRFLVFQFHESHGYSYLSMHSSIRYSMRTFLLC